MLIGLNAETCAGGFFSRHSLSSAAAAAAFCSPLMLHDCKTSEEHAAPSADWHKRLLSISLSLQHTDRGGRTQACRGRHKEDCTKCCCAVLMIQSARRLSRSLATLKWPTVFGASTYRRGRGTMPCTARDTFALIPHAAN